MQFFMDVLWICCSHACFLGCSIDIYRCSMDMFGPNAVTSVLIIPGNPQSPIQFTMGSLEVPIAMAYMAYPVGVHGWKIPMEVFSWENSGGVSPCLCLSTGGYLLKNVDSFCGNTITQQGRHCRKENGT